MKLSKDEFFARVHEMVGDDASEASTAFVEDMTDTYTDLETRAAGDGVDWHQKYEENDKAWRKKYQDRFFRGGSAGNPNTSQESADSDDGSREAITINDLFKKEG